MESVEYSKQRKSTLKGVLKRFHTYVEKLDVTTTNKVELKSKLLKQDREATEFDKVITILSCATENEAEKDKLFDESDEYNLTYTASRNTALTKLGFSVPEPFMQISTLLTATDITSQQSINKPVHLHPIPLPAFSGQAVQWPEFADLFKSLVTNNKGLSNVERLLHLKSCLSGEASKAVSSITILDANFQVAWDILQKQYEVPKLLIETRVKALFALPKINDNPTSIREHLNQFRTNCDILKANKSLTIDNLLIQFAIIKFDEETRERWEDYSFKIEAPTYDNIIEFLTQRSQVKAAANKNASKKPREGSAYQLSHFTTNKADEQQRRQKGCDFCSESHKIYTCAKFLNLTVSQRFDVVKERRWCINCLGNGHALKQCKSLRHCFKCPKRHNTLLHNDHSVYERAPESQLLSPPPSSQSASTSSDEKAFTNSFVDGNQPNEILLSTVVIDIKNYAGAKVQCRALLDNGSQPHIVTERLIHFLGLTYPRRTANLAGIGTAATTTKGYATLHLCSKYTNYEVSIGATVVDTITQNIPSHHIDTSNVKLPQNVVLADPQFFSPGPIDLIIGAELFYQLILSGNYTNTNGLALQETRLGWVIAGHLPVLYPTENNVSFHVRATDPLEAQLRMFWEIENVAISTEDESHEYCESHFNKTVVRDDTGRFIVKLPFTPLKDELGNNYEDAKRRLCSIENRLRRNPALKVAYTQFMKEYEDLGHMTRCEPSTTGYFIPHHAVLREQSTSTKCRCVFDASARSSTGVSLNDILYVGPVVQDDLITILMRFRTHPIVFTADIERMYRQFLIHDDDKEYQKILWRNTPDDPISTYRLNTVTYGTACAPFLATRCLKELAIQEQNASPGAAKIILNDFYVDDCITGCASVSEAQGLKRELLNSLNSAGLPLQKWRSNMPELMSECANSSLILNKSTMNTLGLSWDHIQDVLLYLPTNSTPIRKITKRSILAEIAKLFDPLGLVGPVILKAKLLLQKLWKLNYGWDQSLPDDINKEWTDYSNELCKLVLITIPRCIFETPYASVELHGFSDASKVAYGACIYVRATDIQGIVHTQLLCAKSRVAPVKTDTQCEATLPRLELCGALLLAQLIRKVSDSIHVNFNQFFCWSDSTIVLCWLATTAQTYKTFVSNRVRDIQKLTANCEWRHVRTDSNPADLISRGATTSALRDNNLWWCGPSFLKLDKSQWPQLELSHPVSTLECKPTSKCTFIAREPFNIVEKYSSLVKLVRVTAYITRFSTNCKSLVRRLGLISATEYRESLHRLIKCEQGKSFPTEINQLRRNAQLSPSSHLLNLNPFLDEEGMLRVGGRLCQATITANQQHPIILPSHNKLTEMIVNYEHLRNLHAGQQSVLASLRMTFWPLSGKSTVRKILRRCVKCCRARPKFVPHIMGHLPQNRVIPSRPFSSCGLDYCGPFSIIPHHRRGARSSKAYVAVFVCFATKATHLEVVGDLTTASCLNALRRFIARRGIISHIYSDNGTNFIGCNNELHRLARLLTEDEAQAHLTSLQISWHFNPPHSPHFGGLWEAAVKAAKHHLRRVAGQVSLTFEELSTILAQTEAVLNSRPITPVSNDINDLGALTPGHFLIGQPLTALPDVNLIDVQLNRLSRWQRVQQINQHFWQRWHREYLSLLQTRTKWKQQHQQLQVGALVIVRDDQSPPLRWKLGRVLEVIFGVDKVPRVAKVRTISGEQVIAINRLCLLPIETHTQSE